MQYNTNSSKAIKTGLRKHLIDYSQESDPFSMNHSKIIIQESALEFSPKHNTLIAQTSSNEDRNNTSRIQSIVVESSHLNQTARQSSRKTLNTSNKDKKPKVISKELLAYRSNSSKLKNPYDYFTGNKRNSSLYAQLVNYLKYCSKIDENESIHIGKNLTPIPTKREKYSNKIVKNKATLDTIEKQERSAVLSRRKEYAISNPQLNQISPQDLKFIFKGIIAIQRNWRIYRERKEAAVQLQACFRGYRARRVFYEYIVSLSDEFKLYTSIGDMVTRVFLRIHFRGFLTAPKFHNKAKCRKVLFSFCALADIIYFQRIFQRLGFVATLRDLLLKRLRWKHIRDHNAILKDFIYNSRRRRAVERHFKEAFFLVGGYIKMTWLRKVKLLVARRLTRKNFLGKYDRLIGFMRNKFYILKNVKDGYIRRRFLHLKLGGLIASKEKTLKGIYLREWFYRVSRERTSKREFYSNVGRIARDFTSLLCGFVSKRGFRERESFFYALKAIDLNRHRASRLKLLLEGLFQRKERLARKAILRWKKISNLRKVLDLRISKFLEVKNFKEQKSAKRSLNKWNSRRFQLLSKSLSLASISSISRIIQIIHRHAKIKYFPIFAGRVIPLVRLYSSLNKSLRPLEAFIVERQRANFLNSVFKTLSFGYSKDIKRKRSSMERLTRTIRNTFILGVVYKHTKSSFDDSVQASGKSILRNNKTTDDMPTQQSVLQEDANPPKYSSKTHEAKSSMKRRNTVSSKRARLNHTGVEYYQQKENLTHLNQTEENRNSTLRVIVNDKIFRDLISRLKEAAKHRRSGEFLRPLVEKKVNIEKTLMRFYLKRFGVIGSSRRLLSIVLGNSIVGKYRRNRLYFLRRFLMRFKGLSIGSRSIGVYLKIESMIRRLYRDTSGKVFQIYKTNYFKYKAARLMFARLSKSNERTKARRLNSWLSITLKQISLITLKAMVSEAIRRQINKESSNVVSFFNKYKKLFKQGFKFINRYIKLKTLVKIHGKYNSSLVLSGLRSNLLALGKSVNRLVNDRIFRVVVYKVISKVFSRLVLVNRARSFAVLKLALSRLAYRNKDNYWDKYEIGYNKALKGRVTVFKHCSSLKANDLPPCFKFLSGKHLVKVVSKHLKQVHLRIISHLNMISRLRRSLTILDISYKTLKDKLTREIVSRYISNSISNKNQEELKIRIRKYFLVKLTSIANKTKRHSKAKTLIILFFKTRDSIEKHSISTILKGWISFNRFKKKCLNTLSEEIPISAIESLYSILSDEIQSQLK